MIAVGIILIASLALIIAVYRHRETLLTYEWHFTFLPAISSFVLFSLGLSLVASVWTSIMNTIGLRVGLRKHLRFFLVSHAARRLPGSIWNVVGRAYLYKTEGIQSVQTSIASVIEHVITILSGAVITLIFAIPELFKHEYRIIVILGVIFLGILFLNPRLLTSLLKRFGLNEPINFTYLKLLAWNLQYMIVWLIGGVVLFLIGNTIANIGVEKLNFIIGSWSLAGILSALLIFLPSNFGISELGLAFLLSNILPIPVAAVIAISSRIFLTLYELLWAAVAIILIRE